MAHTYDLVILGAGPAGITAAVYASRKRLDFLLITLDIGGQTAWSGDVENYTGYQFITGPDLVLKFQEHIKAFGIEVKMPQEVTGIKKEERLIKIITTQSEYLSRTAIIATGKRPRQLNVPGEKEYKNKGVTYCAICDGPVFKGKKVAVIGGGNSGLDAALQMMKISPSVYLIDIAPELRADPVMVEKVTNSPQVEIWNNSRVRGIYGSQFVERIDVEQEGKVYTLPVEGVLVEVGLVPNAEFAHCLAHNEKREIIVDCYNRTNVEGIFAAGDVTNVPEKQIIIACGEGSKACLSASKYLLTHTF